MEKTLKVLLVDVCGKTKDQLKESCDSNPKLEFSHYTPSNLDKIFGQMGELDLIIFDPKVSDSPNPAKRCNFIKSGMFMNHSHNCKVVVFTNSEICECPPNQRLCSYDRFICKNKDSNKIHELIKNL